MNKELKNVEIYDRLRELFNVPEPYRTEKNKRDLVWKMKTLGSYEKVPKKLAFYPLADRIEILGVDSMNKEKVYETFKLVRINNNTDFRIE